MLGIDKTLGTTTYTLTSVDVGPGRGETGDSDRAGSLRGGVVHRLLPATIMSKKKPNSQDLIPVGPKHVQNKYNGKRDVNGLKPSTSRALVLRNGKYGARGTGEVILAGRITGREKLDLLAGTVISLILLILLLTPALEDLVSQRSRTALMAPLKLDKCIRIADSQYNGMLKHTLPILSSNSHSLQAYLDDIANLKDTDLFYDRIVVELVARSPHGTEDGQQSARNPSHVASVVSTRYRL